MEILHRHMGRILVASMVLSGAGILFFGFSLLRTIKADISVPSPTSQPDGRGRVLEIPSLKPRDQYELVVRRNIFSLSEPRPQAPQAPVETPLNVRLKGTVVSPGGLALAMVEDPAQRREDLYIVGDKIQDARILRILPNQVVLQRAGREETLSLFTGGGTKAGTKPSAGVPKPQPGQSGTVTPTFPAAMLPHVSAAGPSSPRGSQRAVQTLMANLRLKPHFQEGKPSGFVVGEVPKGSVFEEAGLKVGDIVVGINDEEVRTPNQLLKAYREISETRELWLDVLRNGQEETIEVEIEAALPQQ